MTARLQQARRDMRRDLHREMAVPALLLAGTDDPVAINVRIHELTAFVGDIPGLNTARSHDTTIHLRFRLDELDAIPSRGTKVSVSAGEAYLLGEALDPYRGTVDVGATRLSAVEAQGLPLPDCA